MKLDPTQELMDDLMGSIIHQATVTLIDQQIKTWTLPAIVPAHAGYFPWFLHGFIGPLTGTAYTGAAGAINFQVGNTSVSPDLRNSDVDDLLQNPGGNFSAMGARVFYDGSLTCDVTDIGEALTLIMAGGDPNLGDGNAANTLPVVIEFRVYDFLLKKFLTTVESGWTGTVFA